MRVYEHLWANKDSVPIVLDPASCMIRIYKIDLKETPRAVDPSDDGFSGSELEILAFCPIRRTGTSMLEPGTQSRIQSTIVLEKSPIYEVRSRIEMKSKHGPHPHWWLRRKMKSRHGTDPYWWFRRKVFISRPA